MRKSSSPVSRSPLSQRGRFGTKGLSVPGIVGGVALAALLLGGCTSTQPRPRSEQLDSPPPYGTYVFHNDQELADANQKADVYCQQFHATNHTATMYPTTDGSQVLKFQCTDFQPTVPLLQATVPTPPPPPPDVLPPFNPGTRYTYNTDRQLAELTANARAYCTTNGGRQIVSKNYDNDDGSKTVAFQCVGP